MATDVIRGGFYFCSVGIVTNRCSKMAHFIHCNKIAYALSMTRILFGEVVHMHRGPTQLLQTE